ncbi:MAG TPA: NFACT family protein [Trueperaceae bacterium]
MEGLLIAEELRRLAPLLPAGRNAWRFPDPQTFVLPLEQGGALWLYNRPPEPRLELLSTAPRPGRTHSGFQDLLAARASGDLVAVRQRKLDRVVTLEFGAATGFVETPAVRLVAELTGRNCNLILLDEEGIVLGAAREITSEVNRFRQVVSGRPYRPPPPYEKLDPREASREELRGTLEGRQLRHLRKVVDGIGPRLTAALARTARVSEDRPLQGAELERAAAALVELTNEPTRTMQRALGLPDAATQRETERRDELSRRLRERIARELDLVRKRLGDLERARAGIEEADTLRRTGELLLAFAHEVPGGSDEVTLDDFTGETVTIRLDPARNAAANAQAYFDRARKREGRARQAESREPELREREEELSALVGRLDDLGDAELEQLQVRFLPFERTQRRRGVGARYVGPHGLPVLVGRNARENDEITFKIARSRDVWLHVQGYHGSHVIIQAENREVPFDTILFAAQLAAGYSKAAGSDNVPVDYTLRKNVWKVKGQPAGSVNFTRHKTVYVTPDRRPETESTEQGRRE